MMITRKIQSAIFVCLSATLLQYTSSAELPSNEVRSSQYKKTRQLILSGSKDTAAVNLEIRRLEKMHEPAPAMYVCVVCDIVNDLYRCDREKWHSLIETLADKVLVHKNISYQNKEFQIRMIIYCLLPNKESHPATISAQRTKRISALLEIWHNAATSIDENWDPNDPKNFLPPYTPPASYQGIFISGMSPEGITDAKVKKEFEEHNADMKKRNQRTIAQKEARELIQTYKDKIKKYLIDSYSLRPFASAELETLLKKCEFDEASAKEILEVVKQAEKVVPPPSPFRTWRSQDRLFETKAKFVSLDKDRLMLEKADGKQTTIDLSALRQEDQEYVKEQMKMNEQPK